MKKFLVKLFSKKATPGDFYYFLIDRCILMNGLRDNGLAPDHYPMPLDGIIFQTCNAVHTRPSVASGCTAHGCCRCQ